MAQLTINNTTPSIESQVKTQRLIKIKNSSKLSNRINPSFDSWYLAIISKFKVNADHFKTEDTRKYQIYIYTEEIANDYFYSYFEPNTKDPFETAEEIIIYFK